MKYNGWSNRETWLIGVHFAPETKKDLEHIKETLEKQKESFPPFFRDFVDLSPIDWDELASCLDDDEEDEEENGQ